MHLKNIYKIYASPINDFLKRFPAASFGLFLFSFLLPSLLFIYFHKTSLSNLEQKKRLDTLVDRLENLESYDLHSLEKATDKVMQISKLLAKDGQPIKFTAETATEERRFRERLYVMQKGVLIDAPTLLRLLEILQPAALEKPTLDTYVKMIKIRKEKSGFMVQLSLLKRELRQ